MPGSGLDPKNIKMVLALCYRNKFLWVFLSLINFIFSVTSLENEDKYMHFMCMRKTWIFTYWVLVCNKNEQKKKTEVKAKLKKKTTYQPSSWFCIMCNPLSGQLSIVLVRSYVILAYSSLPKIYFFIMLIFNLFFFFSIYC